MRNHIKPCHLILLILLLTSCATSMTPVEMTSNLKTMTKSKFMTQAEAQEAVSSNTCRYLTKGRDYVAPVGFTAMEDLRFGAQGIDEWVQLDGGNAYVLNSYFWATIDEDGSTQLHVTFDTLLCE